MSELYIHRDLERERERVMMMEVRVRSDGVGGGTQGDVLTRISPKATVAELKVAVADRAGVEPAQQRLVFSGKVLDDDASLEAYSIRDGHAVLMSKKVAPVAVALPVLSSRNRYEHDDDDEDDDDEDEEVGEELLSESEAWGNVEGVEELEVFVRELRRHYGRNVAVAAAAATAARAGRASTTGRRTGNTGNSTNTNAGSMRGVAPVVHRHPSDFVSGRHDELLLSALHQQFDAEHADDVDVTPNDDGECIEVVVGFAVGFAFGIIAALCLIPERSGFASMRFKAGIFMGLCFYMVMLALRFISRLVAWR